MADDLDRTDVRKQPLHIPVLGTPAGVYTDPGEDWDGAPVREALSTGAEESGVTPGDGVNAQMYNDQVGRLGQGLATILDSEAINWTAPSSGGDIEGNAGAPSFAGMGNGQVMNGLGPIVAPGQWYGGIECEVLVDANASGLFWSRDGRNWDDDNAIGHAEVPDNMAAGHYNFTGDGLDYVTIVVYSEEGDGEFRATDNFGSAWYNAGFLPASAEDSETHVMGYFEPSKRFFWCARSQLYFFDADDDLSSNAEWTRITTSGFWPGAPPASPKCFAASPTECAFGISGGPNIIRSADGIAWAAANTGLTPAGLGVDWLYWSEDHQLWIMIGVSSGTYSLWTAPAGMASWTQRPAPTWRNGSAITPLRQVACLGRTIVLLAANSIYASRNFGGADGTEWVRMPPLASTGVVDNWQWIRNLNGRLWVGHQAHPDGTGGSGSTIEYTMSGVLPSELRRVTSW